MKNKSIYPSLLPSRSVIFFLIFISAACITGRKVSDVSSIWSVAASLVNLVTIAALVLLAKKENSSYLKLINYRKGQSRPKHILLFTLLFVVIGMSGMYLSGLICYGTLMPAVSLKIIAPIPKALAVLNILILPVTTALAEDGLYLGGGVNHIKSTRPAIIFPAFFYALQHCFIPTLFDPRYMLYRFLSFLPLTVIFCIYYRKNRDPLPVMISHTILDLATAMSILAYDQMSSMM